MSTKIRKPPIYEEEFKQDWYDRSVAGDEDSLSTMFEWVQGCALDYYTTKSISESLLSSQDAQDLAGECVFEFSRSWRRIRCVPHYCRRMYKNNLRRFLKRKRRDMLRECDLSAIDTKRVGWEATCICPEYSFESLSDEDRSRIRFASRELADAEEVVRDLFRYRVFEGSLTYREIATLVNASETSLRMHMARFNRRVRDRYAQEHANHRLNQ